MELCSVKVILVFFFCIFAALPGSAQSPPKAVQTPLHLTLAQAVRRAQRRYPRVAAALARQRAGEFAAALARAQYLPSLGLVSQFDRGTDNSPAGLLFPSALPSISGTVAGKYYAWNSVWTSSAGAYFNWELYDFGRRHSDVAFYQALARQAARQAGLARLQAGAHAADAYLSVLAARAGLQVARADVARWHTLDQIVRVLVHQQLRPGADASRTDAELAGARIRQASALARLQNTRALLAQAVGSARARLVLEPDGLLAHASRALTPAQLRARPAAASHPQARARHAALTASRFQLQELARADRPRAYLLAAAYGRGTGIQNPGQFAAHLNGLWPDSAGNWAVGLGIEYSLTRHFLIHRRQAVARARIQRAQAQYQQVIQFLRRARRQAAADLVAARQLELNSPIELRAAQTGEAQARARYRAGLAGIVDLANAEQLLSQAQSDDSLSRLAIWRAELETAYAQGSLRPWLQAVQAQAANGGH